MHDIKKTLKFIVFFFFVILLVGGILAEIGTIENTPSWAPNIFMIIGCLIILFFSKGRLLYSLIFIGILGFVYEVLGVKIGILFGSYNYTNVFNIKLFSVPLVMISAWIIIANFCLTFIQSIKNKFFILYGSAIMVIIDLVVDPIAVHGLKIWTWDDKGPYFDIPTHNFLGWFFLSIPIFTILYFSKNKVEKQSRLISNLVICFFSIIGFINEIYFPSILGIFLVIINFLLFIKEMRIKSNVI